MDKVHEPDAREWIGERVGVADFKEKWTRAIEAQGYGEYDNEDDRDVIMEAMNITESALETLEADFRLIYLCSGQENLDTRRLPEKTELETVKLLKEDLHQREQDVMYRSRHTQFIRRTSPLLNMNLAWEGEQIRGKFPKEEAVPSGEAVLIVQVFKPIKTPVGFKKVRMGHNTYPFRVLVEVAVLGNQTLQDLRAKIPCISDDTAIGDFSENPDKTQGPSAKEVYKSGFFYIGDTFYNDMTDQSCRNYSEVIINWAKNPRRGLGPFKKALMEDTTFDQLEIRLGYPYVYVHQGYCEHLIVFSDLRMHHIHDSQRLVDYPFATKCFPITRRVFCMLCRKNTANVSVLR